MRRPALIVTAAAVLTAGLLTAAPAFATPDPGPAPVQGSDTAADVVIDGLTFGTSVGGAIGAVPDPTVPYPVAVGFQKQESPALIGLKSARDPGPATAQAYCVNLTTTTYDGVRYSVGDWSTGGVANVDQIQWILTHNYPYVPLPPGTTKAAEIAAVQSAVWYFSDGWVVSDRKQDAPTYDRTAAIVADAIAHSGTPPVTPTLEVTPRTVEVPSDAPAAGPFDVTGTAGMLPPTLERATGLTVYSDAARTTPVTVGSPVPVGSPVWVGGALSGASSFSLTETETLPVGTLYLSDPDPARFQKIVLATDSALTLRAGADVAVYPANSVVITKTIGGERAGRQGEIALDVTCDPAPGAGVVTRATIPAGSPAGTVSRTIASLRSGATCTVTESADGANDAARLSASTITPASFVVPAAGAPAATVAVTDTYVSPRPVLPATGAPEATAPLLAGAGFLAAGALLVALRRRRRA